jgi:hypothetical protein
MCHPQDRSAIAAIEQELGAPIRPYVAPELRILYYLERYYGIKRRTRYVRAADPQSAPRQSRRERRATQPLGGLSSPPPVNIAPKKHRDAAAGEEKRPPITIKYEAAQDLLDAAKNRHEIADALMGYCRGRFAGAALLLTRAQNAIGWRAFAPGLGPGAAERLNLPLGASSSFQIAHDSGRSYVGKAPSAGHPIETELWKLFALDDEPESLAVLPVLISGRVINLLYVHAFAGEHIDSDAIRQLESLCDRSGQAYRRLISASKAGARS